MRAFEDFTVGEVMTFGPVAVTAEDVKSFAERFNRATKWVYSALSSAYIERRRPFGAPVCGYSE
jgi:hypothetical protein